MIIDTQRFRELAKILTTNGPNLAKQLSGSERGHLYSMIILLEDAIDTIAALERLYPAMEYLARSVR